MFTGPRQTRRQAQVQEALRRGFGQPNSTPHPGISSVGAELLQDFIRQDGGSTETLSEAYGCSCGDSPARSAPYETTLALAPWPNPEVGVETRYSPVQIHRPAARPSARVQIPRSFGQECPGAGIQTCCGTHGCLGHGWGATYNGHAVSGVWTGPQLRWHINCLELLAVRLALSRLRGCLQRKDVLVRTDNTANVVYINRQGLRSMSNAARHLLLWSQKHLRSLACHPHPRSVQWGSSRSSTSRRVETPPRRFS